MASFSGKFFKANKLENAVCVKPKCCIEMGQYPLSISIHPNQYS